MEELRRTGEFSVPSKNFPGQFHVWRLTLLLQKGNDSFYKFNLFIINFLTIILFFVGSNNIRATARQQYAFALTNLIIWIPNRLIGNRFSIPHGFKKIFKSIFWCVIFCYIFFLFLLLSFLLFNLITNYL